MTQFGAESSEIDELVVQTLAGVSDDAQSFDRDTILPLLRIYDPKTAAKKTIEGEEITTYAGALIVFWPKSRESAMDDMRNGRVPDDFDPSWIAKGQSHE